jgi:hypothetical protein
MILTHAGKGIAVFILLSLIALSSCFSQSSTPPKREYISNHMLWTTLTGQGKIKGKFSYQFDLEYRRQADPMQAADPNTSIGHDHYNVFKHSYQYAVRTSVQYQLNSSLSFAVPITLFGTWNGSSFQPELRPALQATISNSIGRIALSNRYRYEFRYFGEKKNIDDDQIFGDASTFHFTAATRKGRFRYMLRATMPLNNKTIVKGTYYAVTSAEVFLNTGKNVNNNNLLDQLRFYGGLGYKFSDNMRVELGYMNMIAYRLNNGANNNVDVNNVLWLRFTVENFNRVFKQKEKEAEAAK